VSAPKSVNVSTTAIIVHTPGLGENVKIQNTGGVTAYLSNNSGVTVTTGLPLTPGSTIELFNAYNVIGSGAGVGIYGITGVITSAGAATATTLSVLGIVT
jgi:hypothetical protein